MIIDSHMHVGDFPLFNVSIDQVIVSEMPARQVAPDLVLHPGHGPGHDRVTYDSGTPFLHPSVALAKVRASAPSTDLTDRVLRENSHAAFSGDDTCRGGRSRRRSGKRRGGNPPGDVASGSSLGPARPTAPKSRRSRNA